MRAELAANGFEVVAVNLDEEPKDGVQFLKEFPVDYPVASDPSGDIAEVYNLKGMPTSYILDRDGNIVVVHESFVESDMPKIKSEVLKLLNN